MTQDLTASAVVYEIEQVDSDAEMEALLDRLRADRSNAAAVLSELAMNRSVEVRDWVPWAAKRVLGNDAMPILLQLVNDRDPDVADGAVEEILKLDLSEARKLAKTFRKRVHSKYFYQSAAAMWALAAIGDTSAIDIIREAGRKADNAIQRNTAVVVEMMLADREEEIVSRIRGHDHDLMPWLARAARMLGTANARAALEDCAKSAPDEECRSFCRNELSVDRR